MKMIQLSAGLLLAFAIALPGHALLLSFDSGSTTEGTGRPINTSFSVDSAYLETEDEFGDPLPVPVWTPIEPAKIGNPADAGYGDAISGAGALDANFDQILFTFDSPIYLREFSTILDDSAFGNLGDWPIQFFSASDRLLAEIFIDQTQPRFVAQLTSGPIGGVKKILLPSGAYYDEVKLNVPEGGPGIALLALMVVGGAVAARHGKGGAVRRSPEAAGGGGVE